MVEQCNKEHKPRRGGIINKLKVKRRKIKVMEQAKAWKCSISANSRICESANPDNYVGSDVKAHQGRSPEIFVEFQIEQRGA